MDEYSNKTNFEVNQLSELYNYDLKAFLLMFLKYWKLVLLSVLIFLSSAFFYLQHVNKKFLVKALILLKDEGKTSNNDLEVFSDLGIVTPGIKNIEDEIEVIKSIQLISQVVLKKNFHIRYFLKQKFNSIELYKASPISIKFLSDIDDKLIIKVELISKDKFKLFQNDIYIDTFSFHEKIELSDISFIISKNNSTKINDDISMSIIISKNSILGETHNIIQNIGIKTLRKNSNGLILSTATENIERSKSILNGIIREYNLSSSKENNIASEQTIKFIDERISLISKDLLGVEKQVEIYKRSNKIANLGMETSLILSKTSKNNERIIALSTQIELGELLDKYINADGYRTIKIELEDRLIMSNVVEYNRLINEFNYLNKTLNKNHPLKKKLIFKLSISKKELISQLSSYLEIKRLNLKKLLSDESVVGAEIGKIPKKEREFRAVDRQQKVKESLYIYLLKKREAIAISSASESKKAKIINEAFALNTPIFPKTKFVYMIALTMGLMIPIGSILGLKALDSKIHNANDIENILGIPILGEISKSKETEHYLVNDEDFSGTAESLRLFDANLDFMLAKLKIKKRKILITSSISGEGKSFIALNYARTLAFSKKKVLLVGMDLRAPKLLTYARLSSDYGVSDYVKNSNLQLEDLIVKSTELRNLHIIGGGKIPRTPTDYIRSPRINELFDTAEKVYDFIVIDSPPIDKVTDTLLLNSYADLCVYVVRADFVDKSYLSIPEKLKEEKRFKNLGILINSVDYSKSYYYRKYGYGYHGKNKKKWFRGVI